MGTTPEVVVWEADGRVDGRVGYGAPIARRLRAAGMTVSVVPLTERQPNEAELHAKVHLVSGGSTSVDSDEPWIRAFRGALTAVLHRSLAGQASLTGICFGAQLLATLLAGRGTAGPHPRGMQAGLVKLRPYAEADHTEPDIDAQVVVSSFHYHHIDRRRLEASGARIVADSRHTEVQAFECGAGVRGVQFHPELSPAELGVTLRVHRGVVQRYSHGRTRTVAAVRPSAEATARWSEGAWRRFVEDPARQQLTPIPPHEGRMATDSKPMRLPSASAWSSQPATVHASCSHRQLVQPLS